MTPVRLAVRTMAMGAGGATVLRMVLRQGVRQVVAGIVLGAGLAALLASAMSQTLLFQVSAYDPAMFAGIATALALTGLAACVIPARRAAAVDPMTALRYQ